MKIINLFYKSIRNDKVQLNIIYIRWYSTKTLNNFNKNFIVKILLEACQLELLEQFGPRKFHTKN